jgi:tetratricopeptide (TPR) repeat protein
VGQGYSVFISAVTREFGVARDALANALQARGIDVKVQRSFGQGDGTTLALLHDYIRKCDRVIAVIGAYAGLFPPEGAVTDRFRDMPPPGMTRASLTQWEVIFARHYRREIYFFEADGFVPEQAALEGDDKAAQAAWRHWLFDGDQGLFRRQFQTADGLRANVMELDWRKPTEAKPSNLPGSIGHFFKGRKEFLDKLRESFKRNAAAAITGKAVHGLGGVGKTRTAIEYGHACADDYVATFFLTGKSESDLNDSLAALAGAPVLDLPERNLPDLDARIAAVIRWLRANPGWLLIIDNADDPAAAKAVRAFLAQVSRAGGHILITSRLSDWGNMVEPLELDLLSVEAAMDLLRESTPHRTKRAGEDEALAPLADAQLGCLSLALVQAAAFIEAQRIGFADYSERFERETARLLDRLDELAKDNLGYPLSVAATWQASFEQLNDAGRLLLEMLAWLSIEPIPRTLFDAWPDAKTVDLEEGLAELTRYSLVHWEAENSAITLHRLVAQVTRDNLDAAARDQALGALFPWLYAVNPDMNASDVRCWPQLLPLLPHALLLFERTRERGPYPRQVNLHDEYATLLWRLARYPEAEPLYRRALAIDEASRGSNHPAVAIRLNNLALLLRDTSRLVEAEPLYRRALAIDEASYGPDHPAIATRLNNLAALLEATDRQVEAEPLYRRALAIDEASSGPDHPDVATSLNNLAELLRRTNRLSEAEPLYRRAIAIDEASYGPDHPEVATDLNNLAGLLETTNRLAEAELLYRRALAIGDASYGPDHPAVATRLNNLAGLLQDTNRWAEAEPLYRRAALILLRSSKASEHLLPNTAPVLQNYTFALIKAGRAPDGAGATIASLMREAGFDPTELWPQIFGDDD